MDEEKLNEFIDIIHEMINSHTNFDHIEKNWIVNDTIKIVQQIFQYGYDVGSQETATDLGKQVEQQLKQAFKGF